MTKIDYHMSNEDYHKSEGISNSGLSLIKVSAANYKWAKDCPNKGDDHELKFGSAFHSIVLEGQEAFDKEFVIAPKFDRRTKAGKEAEAEFNALHQGKTVMTAEDGSMISDMHESVLAHPTASKLLKRIKSEVSMWWTDPETGEKCKMRADGLIQSSGIIVDLKTCDDAKKLDAKILDFNYHQQGAFYSEGYEQVFGEPLNVFIFIFVSKSKSLGRHGVRVIKLSEDFKNKGRLQFRELLDVYHDAKETDSWFDVETVDLPRWAK